jgi:hypothetical protein
MFVKIHHSYRDTIAICDSDLIGKTFEKGEKQIIVSESFFKGEEKNEDEVLEIISGGIEEDCTFNIVGKVAVELAIKKGIIKRKEVKHICEVPIALVLL